MTAPSPCPYLDGQVERKAFTHLTVPNSDDLHSGLSQAGFRRSQTIAYKPACPGCNACHAIRVRTADFTPGKRWRRVLNRNAQVVREPVRSEATREQYAVFKRYVTSRHDGEGMSDMSFDDYAYMVSASPVQTLMFEYREPVPDAPGGDRLVAACLTDVMRDGFSLVYSFFDPSATGRSLGNYVILDHIRHATELGIPHVYLGYWIPGSRKMNYKRDFDPLEVLDGTRWRPLQPDER